MTDNFRRKVRRRIGGVMCVLMAACGAILVRLYILQVLGHTELSTRAASQILTTVQITPQRGRITDRHGRPLAVDVEVDSIFAVPRQVEDARGAARQLARVTGRKATGLERVLSGDGSFTWLLRQVSPDLTEKVASLGLAGIGSVRENRRFYPKRELAAHVIGMAGVDNQGLEGIEYYRDSRLSRKASLFVVEKDALGRDIFVAGPPDGVVRGEEIRLTLDEAIQFAAQEELARGVREAGAKGGGIVVLDPRTGEILAMANTPFFNPNEFKRYGAAYFRNRTVTDMVEPGSTMKTFLLAAALEDEAVTTHTLFYCEKGSMPFMGRILHDVHPHEYLDAAGVVINSSNIGATKMAQRVGAERYYRRLRAFGFGERTGVDLPGEAPGLLRPVSEWSGLSISAVAIGQEISVTPLQLAAAFAAVVNGGTLMRPYVTRGVISADGSVVESTAPTEVRRVISTATSRRVREVLSRVITQGTGAAAAVTGYAAAGKTGTAQKFDPATGTYSNKRYLASFVGCAPLPEPRVVVVVMIDEPKESIWGGSTAGPVFSRVTRRILRYLNVPSAAGGRLLAGAGGARSET